jgi:hypothetical protein
MTQADSVLSTPPTNTSPTRRNILGTIAAAGATALTLTPARAAPSVPDPIYAAIERHNAACIPWDAAIDVRAEFPEGSAPMTDEQWEQRDLLDEAVEDARGTLEKAGVDLINTAPTTLAGIARALNYIREQLMQEHGTYMPSCLVLKDDDDPGGWVDAFLDTIEYAARELDRTGKAAQS